MQVITEPADDTPVAASDLDAEFKEALDDLAADVADYAPYAPRPLTAADMEGARQVAIHFRAHAVELHQVWRDRLEELPIPGELVQILDTLKAGVEPEPTGIRASLKELIPFRRRPQQNVAGVFGLVDRLFAAANLGHHLLHKLRPVVAHVIHHQTYAQRLYGESDEAKFRKREAAEILTAVEQVVASLEDDVESQRSQIEMLGLYTQTTLSNAQTVLSHRLQGLTRLLTLLTIFLLIATLIALSR